MIRETIWRAILPEAYGWGGLRLARFANQFREKEQEVSDREAEAIPELMGLLSNKTTRGECFIPVDGLLQIHENILLQLIFSTFRPKQLGVIDFHGAQRHYGRELVQGINLTLDSQQHQQQSSESALYNYSNKYNNVKSEMAASYVGEILAEQAGTPRASQSSLTNTLVELFSTFFPEKKFGGPVPTAEGTLRFPVTIANSGGSHDLDDLSSGEKEILYGYLRIRNSAPRFSIILLDEPELHLNPRLIRGLPQFYREHLGVRLNNQIWLVTHSDTLIREIVGREGFDVFHMLPAALVSEAENQLKRLSLEEDLPLLMTDLVGDLAAYRPIGKTLIFEGGGDTDFDQRVVYQLFPEIAGSVNLISGTNKAKVQALHELLDKIGHDTISGMRFFSIVDRDAPTIQDTVSRSDKQYMWDVYHIENYLISPFHIRNVLRAIGKRFLPSEDGILESLKECARERMGEIVRHEMSASINDTLIRALNIGVSPNDTDLASSFGSAVSRSVLKISQISNEVYSEENLRGNENAIRDRLNSQLDNGTWVMNFPGRSILRTFCGAHCAGTPYTIFRNLILSNMADTRFKPEGMKRVIDQILDV